MLLAACSNAPSPPTATDSSAPRAPSSTPREAGSTAPASLATPEPASGACAESAEVAIFASPRSPRAGAPLKVMVIAEKPLAGELVLQGADATASARHGGPPYFWYAEIPSPAVGGIPYSRARQ